MNTIEIGRLLRAGISGFVVGCRVNQIDFPSFGAMVRVPLGDSLHIFGLIYDILIQDDGLVRQLITAETVDEDIILDNRINRNVPAEMSVMAIGYQQDGHLFHLLPPRPALSLDVIYLCNEEEICRFTGAGRFGYFRHILQAKDLPVGELLAAHLQQAGSCQRAAGRPEWTQTAAQELIVLLRDDFPTLMSVLGALGDAIPDF